MVIAIISSDTGCRFVVANARADNAAQLAGDRRLVRATSPTTRHSARKQIAADTAAGSSPPEQPHHEGDKEFDWAQERAEQPAPEARNVQVGSLKVDGGGWRRGAGSAKTALRRLERLHARDAERVSAAYGRGLVDGTAAAASGNWADDAGPATGAIDVAAAGGKGKGVEAAASPRDRGSETCDASPPSCTASCTDAEQPFTSAGKRPLNPLKSPVRPPRRRLPTPLTRGCGEGAGGITAAAGTDAAAAGPGGAVVHVPRSGAIRPALRHQRRRQSGQCGQWGGHRRKLGCWRRGCCRRPSW